MFCIRYPGLVPFLIICASSAACGVIDPGPVVIHLAVQPSSATLFSIGGSQTFAASARDENGNNMSEQVRWSISNGQVATLDRDRGTSVSVTARGDGFATLTVRLGDLSATSQLVVTSRVESVQIMHASSYPPIRTRDGGVEGWVDRSMPMVAVAFTAEGMDMGPQPVTWRSSDPDVARIAAGEVPRLAMMTGVSLGRVTISATISTVTASYETVVHTSYRPALVAGGHTFTSVTGHGAHTCAIDAGGAAYCWGSNAFGQLGDGTQTGRSVPVPVTGGISFAQVSAGEQHTCGISLAGAAYCWGRNVGGQLGDGSTVAFSATPVLVAGGLEFKQVSAGWSSFSAGWTSCGLTTTGAAYCWGNRSRVPVAVPGNLQFTALDVGRGTCAVAVDATGCCWGPIVFQPDGRIIESLVPVVVGPGIDFAQLGVGDRFVCGLDTTGAAWCWGKNFDGQLGDIGPERPTPGPVAGGLTFASLSVGHRHSCALTATGEAHCWGRNSHGQTGNGYTSTATPVAVLGALQFAELTAAADHSCGLTLGGDLYCWGSGGHGALGGGFVTAAAPR